MKKRIILIITFLTSLSLSHFTFADTVNQWVFQGTIKPKSIRVVVVDPATNTTYVGTDTAGVWAKGASSGWVSVGPESGAGALLNSVSALTINNGKIFAGTNTGVFYRSLSPTTSGGWTQVGLAPEMAGSLTRPVYSLQVSVMNSLLIAGTNEGVWIKSMTGEDFSSGFWKLVGPLDGAGSHRRESYDLSLQGSPSIIYVATAAGVLWNDLSSGIGSPWSLVGPASGSGSLTGRIYSLELNVSSSLLYAGTSAGVFFKNISPGDTSDWSLMGPPSGSPGAFAGRADSLRLDLGRSTLYVGSATSVFKKMIGHFPSPPPEWIRVGPPMGTDGTLSGSVSGLYAQESILYAATPDGLFSKNVTDTSGWFLVGGDPALPDADIDSAVLYGSVLYVVGPDLNGVWSKNLADATSHWNPLGAGPGDGSSTYHINTLFLRGSILYAGTSSTEIGTLPGVFFRDLAPGGVPRWIRLDPSAGSSGSLSQPVYSFYAEGSSLYVGTLAGVFYRDLSTPSVVWTRVGSTVFSARVNSLLVYNSKIYAGTPGGVWSKSISPMATDDWMLVGPATSMEGALSGDAAVVNSILVNGNTFYAGTQGGLRSYNPDSPGSRWLPVSSITDSINKMILRQGNNQSRLYLATRSQGIFESDTALMHFSPFNTGLTNTTSVKTLLLSSEPSQPLYAGLTRRGGVYRIQSSVCQNGIVEPRETPLYEECDDGNAILLDGCSTTCTSESIRLSGPATIATQPGQTQSLNVTLTRTGFTASARLIRRSLVPSVDITISPDPLAVPSGTGSTTIPVSLRVGSDVAPGTYDLILGSQVEGGTLTADTNSIHVTVTPIPGSGGSGGSGGISGSGGVTGSGGSGGSGGISGASGSSEGSGAASGTSTGTGGTSGVTPAESPAENAGGCSCHLEP